MLTTNIATVQKLQMHHQIYKLFNVNATLIHSLIICLDGAQAIPYKKTTCAVHVLQEKTQTQQTCAKKQHTF